MSRILWQPSPGPQTAFLSSTAREVMYGGAAAGGKSDALIILPTRRAHHPKHRSIILRRTRPQLQEIIDRTQELYPQIAPRAKWNEKESRWLWPSGAVTQMGYAENEPDIKAFKSFEYDLVAFDELTSFTEKMYLFMFSRNRTKSADLPPWMRSATNPGDIGHEWVNRRFVLNRQPFRTYDDTVQLDTKTQFVVSRQFIPAKVYDNKYLPNRDEYIAGLLAMGDEGLMYLHGIWSNLGGAIFKRPLRETPHRLKHGNYFVVRAMDYGLSDPTAIYWLVVYPELNRHVDIVAELYVNDMSVDGIVDNIRDTEKVLGLKAPAYSVLDPAAFGREGTSMQSVATKLGALGMWFDKANNDRVLGWSEIARRLQGATLTAWEGAAPNLMRTINSLQKDPKKPNDILPRQEDHAADGLRYGLMEIWDTREEAPDDTDTHDAPTQNRDMVFDQQLEDMMKVQQDYVEGLGYYG